MAEAPSTSAATVKPCVYCGLTDHTGPEHLQFVLALSDGPYDEGMYDITEDGYQPW